MSSGQKNAQRLHQELVRAMQEAGHALLEHGAVEGARTTASWVQRWTGARRVVVWPAPRRARWPGEWAAEGPPLPAEVTAELDEDRLSRWERGGRETPPELIQLPAGELLLVPLWGVRRVVGAIVAELEPGTVLGEEVLRTLHDMADLIGIGLEVSARAQAARETEGRLRRWLENLPDPAFLLDHEGMILDVSATVVNLVGRRAADLVGRPLLELAPEREAGTVRTALDQAGREGAAQVTFSAPGRRRGEQRWIELHLRRLEGRRTLAVARDVTVRVRREQSLRVMLEHLPEIVTAGSEQVLWERLWQAVAALLPSATHMWVYRGRGLRVRMVWSTRPDAPRWEFRVRGWGPQVGQLLGQPETSHAFVRSYGPNERESRRLLQRLITGRGAPLLLNDPARQLAVFLDESELESITAFWGGEPPGQLIHCPVLLEGRLDLLVVVDAPPGERPFSWEDALFAWQLTNLAQQALARLETTELLHREMEELRTFREALREVGEASELAELVEHLVARAAESVGAERSALYRRTSRGAWALVTGRGIDAPSVPELPAVPGGLPQAVYVRDLKVDSGWGAVAGLASGALAAVPLVAVGKLLGVLVVASAEKLPWSDAQREMLGFLAHELGLLLSQLVSNRREGELAAVRDELLRSTATATVVLDTEGRIEALGGGAGRVLGFSGPALGRPLLEVVPSAVARRLAPVLERSLLGSEELRERVTLPGGEAEIESRPISAGGALLRIRGAGAQSGADELIGLLEELGIPAAVVDEQGRFGRVNSLWQALGGEAAASDAVTLRLAGGTSLRLAAPPGAPGKRRPSGWTSIEGALAGLADLATALAARGCEQERDLALRIQHDLREAFAESTPGEGAHNRDRTGGG